MAAVSCRPEQQAAAEATKPDSDQPVDLEDGDLKGSETGLVIQISLIVCV